MRSLFVIKQVLQVLVEIELHEYVIYDRTSSCIYFYGAMSIVYLSKAR